MNVIMRFVIPIFSVVWALLEGVRLWLGFSGNLRERVPELAAFVLLTVFPQIPIVILLGFVAVDRVPADLVTAFPQLVFLVLEAVLAFRSVRALMRKQTAEFFRACQTDVEDSARADAAEMAEEDADRGASTFDGSQSARTPIPDGLMSHTGEPGVADVMAAAGVGLRRTLTGQGSGSRLLKED